MAKLPSSVPGVIGVIIEKSECLTLDEFCLAIRIERQIILQMVDHQLIYPIGINPEEWRFDSISLRRGRIAASFYRDLEINFSGIALALELLDRIEELKQEVDILNKIHHE